MRRLDNGESMLEITFPPELPVSEKREDIARALANHQVVIVAGETGSGKTTQLPKIALALGAKRIAHTQPRRIAARAVAERIAEELGSEIGDVVGYQVRFTDRVKEHTRVRVMTDGILLNQTHRDRLLEQYDTIIIDEAHERSLNIDFLLGYVKRLLPKRPDLRVIITSATIDPESFAKHFSDASGNPAPIIEVSGRTYPIEVRYRPLDARDSGGTDSSVIARPQESSTDLFDGVVQAVSELRKEGPGDILVFLASESEIRDAKELLERLPPGRERLEVLPLFGRLSAADQHRVFKRPPAGVRRVILSTNVAETSLTVPGIVYVVDGGTARISRYSARSKVQQLPIEAISQASAGQRAGRAGRTQPGVVIRLYSEEDFSSRPEYTDPEILRTGLASVILQMMALGLGDIAKFPFLTPPDQRGITDGMTLLTELQAIERGRITPIGRQLSRLPIEPRFARMVVEATRYSVVDDVIAVVAGLTVQDVRERPEAERARADQLHARFQDPLGDIMSLLNLWRHLTEEQQNRSSSAFRRMCVSEYINYLRVREWFDLARQLTQAARSLKPPQGKAPPVGSTAEAVHRSMLAGLLSRLGVRDDAQQREIRGSRRLKAQEYIGSRGTRFVLFPGSVLAKRPPEVVMSVELVETSRLFARSNAVIDPAWAEDIARHLVKKQVSEPRWEQDQGAAVAYERVTLFGVPIVGRRLIQYSRVDAEHARELFIRHALVQGEWSSPQSFDRANWQLRRELEQLEERSRRRDIIAEDDDIYDFYDARIPADITSTRSFEGWWRKAQKETPKLLHLTREDLIQGEAASENEFPRVWSYGDQSLKLKYRFDPTAEDDGVTVNVPLPLLPRLKQDDFQKLVPGFREELVAGLIRSLPKQIRRNVVPANDWAKKLLAEIGDRLDQDDAPPLKDLLASAIRRHTSQPVTSADFDDEKLPHHLTPTFRVVDERGRSVASGRHVETLKDSLKDRVRGNVVAIAAKASRSAVSHDIERKGLTTWDFGDLPTHIDAKYDQRGHAGIVRAYPALHDRRTHVDIILVADRNEQARISKRGVRRLVMLSSPSPVSYVREHLSNEEKLLLGGGPYRTLEAAVDDVALATSDLLIRRESEDGLLWHASAFQRVADAYATTLIDEIYRGISLTTTVLNAARLARKAIERATSLNTLGQVKDASLQLDQLVFPGFVAVTGLEQLRRLPTYLAAITHRMETLTQNSGRDRAWQNDIEKATKAYVDAGGSFPITPETSDHLVRTRWLLEEFRVSLFAQHLGTSGSVSMKRIMRALSDTPNT